MTKTTTSQIEKIENQLRNALERYEDRLATSKESFMARFAQSPAYAIRWGADRLVENEEQNRLAQVILKVAERDGLLEATRKVVNRAKQDVLRFSGMTSTDGYSNANDYHEMKAKARFVDDIEGYVDYIHEILAGQKQEQELIENVTDTTKYALQVQYKILLQKMNKLTHEEIHATTKKDKLAAQRAFIEIQSTLQSLSDLAEGLDIDLTN